MIQIADITINVTSLTLWLFGAIISFAGFIGAFRTVNKAVLKPCVQHLKNVKTLADIAPVMVSFLEKDAPKLKLAAAQVLPNGGSSLADKVTRIERVCKDLQEQQQFSHALALSSLENSKTPAFICTDAGENFFVNEAYCTLLKADSKELMGLGWKQYVYRNDDYMEYWQEAFKEGRSFRHSVRFIDKTGDDLYCTVQCNCLIQEGQKRFVGLLRQEWPDKKDLLSEEEIHSSIAARVTI